MGADRVLYFHSLPVWPSGALMAPAHWLAHGIWPDGPGRRYFVMEILMPASARRRFLLASAPVSGPSFADRPCARRCFAAAPPPGPVPPAA